MQARSGARRKPKEFWQVVGFVLLMGFSWFLYWLLNGLLFKQWRMESLMLTATCIALLLIVYKVRGMFVFIVLLPVFAVFALFELLYSLFGLIPLLLDFLSNRVDFSTGVVRTTSYIVNFLTGFFSAAIVFHLLTSEDLNSYLGTEAIFPIHREPKGILGKLEELYWKGKISKEAYEKLKEEYEKQEEGA